jgi:putative flavoprotein involved in K+ transport
MNATEHVDTVVVGGGQAALALGYYLAQQHRDFVILDAHTRIGDAWRLRWDSLRLFTPAKFDNLPGMRFPGDRLSFPTKDQHADYLEAYAARFGLPVHTGVTVEAVRREEDGFLVSAGSRRWWAANVVLATGGSQRPRLPELAASIAPEVLQLHSSRYRNPAQLRPGNVLVVGVGNSGAEIALEVSRTHPTWLAGTPSGQLPVRHGRAAARFVLPVIRFAALHVLTLATPVGRKAQGAMTRRAAPLIRTKMADLAAAGVRSVPRVVGVANGMPVVDGGSVVSVENIIWCTGYRTDFSWVHLAGFRDGAWPGQVRGIVDSVPGLYVLGQEFLFSALSATVTGVCRDARYLARHMNPPRPGGGSDAVPAGERSAARWRRADPVQRVAQS